MFEGKHRSQLFGKKMSSHLPVVWLLMLLLVLSAMLTGCGKKDISDAEHVQRAKQYQVDGDIRSALIELKNALQKNANNSEARLLLAELYVFVGNGTAAGKEIKRAQGLGVNNDYVENLHAKALLIQRHYAEAISVLDKISHKDAGVYVLLGNAYFGLKDLDAARTSYAKAADAKSNVPGARLGLAKISLELGDVAAAKKIVDGLLLDSVGDAHAYQLAADIAFRQGRYEDAVNDYKQAVAQGPVSVITHDQFVAYVGKIRSLLALQRYDEAGEDITKISRSYPRHPVPMYLMALKAYQSNDYDQAKESLQKVLSISSDHLPSILLAGATDFILGNYQQAELHLARYLSVLPSDIRARRLLGRVYLRLNDAEKALEALADMPKNENQDIQTLALIGDALVRNGDFDKGVMYYGRAIEKDPKNQSLRLALAKSYLKSGETEKALNELSQIKGGDKVIIEARQLRIMAALEQGQLAEALSQAKNLVEQHPGSPEAANLLGSLYLAQHDKDPAFQAFSRALELNGDFIPALLNQSGLYLQEGQLSLAEKGFTHVLAIDADNAPSMVGLSQVAAQKGDTASALKWLGKAVETDAKYFLPRLILGKYYLDTKNTDLALKLASEANALMPRDAGALVLLGRAQIAVGKAREAVKTFNTLTEVMPKAAGAYFELAKAYIQMDEVGPAKTALLGALERYPGFIQAAAVLSMLEIKSGNYKDALARGKRLMQDHPSVPDGYLVVSEVYRAKNDIPAVIRILEQGRAKAANQTMVILLAYLYQETGKEEVAISVFQQWLKEHEQDVVVLEKLGIIFHTQGNYQEAQNYYQRALKVDANNVSVLNNMALLLLSMDEIEKALIMAEKAYKLAGDDVMVLDTLAWVSFISGQKERSLQLYERGKDKMVISTVRYHYAVVLAEMGKTQAARAVLQRLIAGDKGFEEREEAVQLYNKLKE